MNIEDLEIQREWGFSPPEGEEWPPEVALTVQTIERQQSNPFFSALADVARMVHNSGNLSDPEDDYNFMLGKVDLMTDMVISYCWHQLSGTNPPEDPVGDPAAEMELIRKKARAVVGQLLQNVSAQRVAIRARRRDGR